MLDNNMNENTQEQELENNISEAEPVNEPSVEPEVEVQPETAPEIEPEAEPLKETSELYEEDITKGLHSMLFKPINDVTIRDLRIRDVFTGFLKQVECGEFITVNDILMSAVKCVASGEPDESAGNVIFAYDANGVKDKKNLAKLFKNSYSNVYSLFSVHNGISLDLGDFGGELSRVESKSFLVANPKKSVKLVSRARKIGFAPTKVGEVISTNKIIFSSNGDSVASIDKSVLKNIAKVGVDVGSEHFDSFLTGYNSVCSLALCNCVSDNNIIRFGLGASISDVFARALGFFSALSYLKTLPARIVFAPSNSATVAVSRPNITDGDYLYLLKLRKDNYELPDKAHFGQLHYYLCEKKRQGIIKDVLPCGENINRVINRLCGQNFNYERLADIPENCFGVIVSVPRGESVNGIKLGCFKNSL